MTLDILLFDSEGLVFDDYSNSFVTSAEFLSLDAGQSDS
jgi:hypothetical protein